MAPGELARSLLPVSMPTMRRHVGQSFNEGSHFIGTIVETLTNGTSKALERVHARDRGCSVASLKGTYAIRRTGVNNVVGGPIAQIGINSFNGDGTGGLIRRTTRSQNGQIRDWTDSPINGSYTVDPDCTGSLFDENGTKSENIVVLDGGKRYFELSVAPGTITTEEGIRLEVED